ncbi:NAD(P)-dependent oxidoreductase [Amantichitinum ursilacus]|uniref:Glyoxylate/hydroxypyruvate reductase B n=1 Tax=Amantichitinum ursilacus TaxID=857265 RepID=A0A0N0XH02_9NEIS|nr:NAD(P)-dependent oxidoreductase [Amantichitinum ursilacus]KPC49071.1 Glyoxylate/hydroxypyruvate reductase B [Amantichitinum ursilacus]
MTQRVVVYKNLPEDLLAQLKARFEITEVDSVDSDGPFAAAMAQADGVIGGGLSLPSAVLDRASKLRTVATVSAGFDQFDVADLTRRGILLSNTPAALTETVADTVLMLMLMTARRGAELAEYVKAGQWQGSVGPDCYSSDVHGKTLGIVGMGRIGLAVGRRAKHGFGMNVRYHNRSQHPAAEEALQAKWLPLDDLLRECDFVCVLLPLSAETEKRFSMREFALMQKHAFFINAGRGRVVDEAALIAALQNGQIAGAGLDVFENEPLDVASPLLKLPQVVALPHVGSATHQTRYDMAASAVSNLIDALEGRLPEFMVNPQAWKRE